MSSLSFQSEKNPPPAPPAPEFAKNVAAQAHAPPDAANVGNEEATRLFFRRNRRLMGILSTYVTNEPNSPLGETCYVALQVWKNMPWCMDSMRVMCWICSSYFVYVM